MKKLIPVVLSVLSVTAHAGTNAALPFRTNDYQVPIPGWWASNAVAIQSALQGIGFTGGGSGDGTNWFYPLEFATNTGGQVFITSLDARLLTNNLPVTNLPASLATLFSNNGISLTNIPDAALQTPPLTDATRFLAATNGNAATTTNLQSTNLVGVVPLVSLPGGLATVSSNNAASLTNLPAAALTGQIADANLPANALTNGAAFLAATNSSASGNFAMATANSSIVWPDTSQSIEEVNNGFILWCAPGNLTLDSFGDLFPTGSITLTAGHKFTGSLDATNLTGGPLPLSVLPAPVVTNYNATPLTLTTTNLTVGGSNNWSGDLAFPWIPLGSLANGNNAGLVILTNSALDLSGPTAPFTLNGIAASRDGRVLWLRNRTGLPWTLANNSGVDPTPQNRILTGQNADLVLTNNPSIIELRYSGVDQKWHIVSLNAGSLSLGSVSTFSSDVASYITNVGLTDPLAESDLQNFRNAMINAGLWSLLKDAWIRYPRFQNPSDPLNRIYSFAGLIGTNYGETWTQDGPQSDGVSTYDVLPVSVTSNSYTVYDIFYAGTTNNAPGGPSGNDFYTLFALSASGKGVVNGDTNGTLALQVQDSGPIYLAAEAPSFSPTIQTYPWGTYLVDGSQFLLGNDPARHSFCFTCSNGISAMQVLDGGNIFTNTVVNITSASYQFNANFNWLTLGRDLSGSLDDGWAGCHSLVLYFTQPLTTNQIQALERCVRWLDGRTKNAVPIGDSNTADYDNLNAPMYPDWNYPWQLEQSGFHNSTLFWNVGINSTEAASWDNPQWETNYILPRAPGGKVTQADAYILIGATDAQFTNGGVNCAQITYQHLSNIWTYCRSNGFKVHAQTLMIANSNSWNGISLFAITPTVTSNEQAINALILSNPSLYDDVLRNDLLFPNLNTNVAFPPVSPYALNGEHLNQYGNNLKAQAIVNHTPYATNDVYGVGFCGTGTNFGSFTATNWVNTNQFDITVNALSQTSVALFDAVGSNWCPVAVNPAQFNLAYLWTVTNHGGTFYWHKYP